MEGLEAALALLRSMPRLRLPGAPAVGGGRAYDEPAAFQEARQAWLRAVVAARADDARWAAAGDAALAAGARRLLGVLAGDGRALDGATQARARQGLQTLAGILGCMFVACSLADAADDD